MNIIFLEYFIGYQKLSRSIEKTRPQVENILVGVIFSLVQFSRFLFPPLVEQNTYINVITLRKKGHATKRNNVVACKNSINYTSKGNGLHGCIIYRKNRYTSIKNFLKNA